MKELWVWYKEQWIDAIEDFRWFMLWILIHMVAIVTVVKGWPFIVALGMFGGLCRLAQLTLQRFVKTDKEDR